LFKIDLMGCETSPIRDPICYPHANRRTSVPQTHEGFSLKGKDAIEFSPQEMLEYIRYIRKHSRIYPRTYWSEFPFYFAMENHKKHFRFGFRPEDLAHIDTINQKALKKHQSYLNRLDRFPLDKAEFYLRLKEAHGVNTVRGLAKITGEDWSHIAKVIRLLNLPEQIKDFLRSNKSDPYLVKLFSLKKLLNIVQQGEVSLQMVRFREIMEGSDDHE